MKTSSHGSSGHIDRRALVARHRVVRTALDAVAPLQVGNGRFAFGVDITGLQTFVPFNTMSHWGWHEFPLPPGQTPADFRGQVWETHGRPVRYPIGNAEQPALSAWLYANPHRINLGRLLLRLITADGREAGAADLGHPWQELDLWTGVIHSRFDIDGVPVLVETACDPKLDLIAVRIDSPMVATGKLAVRLQFPRDDGREFAGAVGSWDHPEAHQTMMTPGADGQSATLVRRLDTTVYHVALTWKGAAKLHLENPADPHHFLLAPGGGSRLEFVCAFSPQAISDRSPDAGHVLDRSADHWSTFWKSGGAVDFTGSSDPRAPELERRVVQSRYLMAVNEAGDLPPQESGLVNNGWNGKFHGEMYWWHAAHWALWDSWPQLEPSLSIFSRFLPEARKRALDEGYRGARWPKCTGPTNRESPHPIHALLIWQQPHPLFFAELDYRAHPTPQTLENWREVVFETADFLASYAHEETPGGRYVLGPPMYVVSENTDPRTTSNPTFELGYWRFGLRIAQGWRERLGLPPDPIWERVQARLAPLPIQDGVYVMHEGVTDMWSHWNFEHPALTGVFGWLPGDGVDREVMRRTAEKVFVQWQFDHVWGWDFPMLAMCAARLDMPGKAVDMLLHPSSHFAFKDNSLADGGPFPYFPSNGGLLYAIAMMAAGWDGAPDRHAPGFPSDGSWVVRAEGLVRAV